MKVKSSLYCLLFASATLMMATASKADPIKKLQFEVAQKTTFFQTTTSKDCPNRFQVTAMTENEMNGYDPGTLGFYLNAYSVENHTENGDFVRENNVIRVKTGLSDGWFHTVKSDIDFPVGVATGLEKQKVENGILTSEYWSNIASVIMVGRVHSKIQYDENTDSFSYFQHSSGVSDVICVFKKHP